MVYHKGPPAIKRCEVLFYFEKEVGDMEVVKIRLDELDVAHYNPRVTLKPGSAEFVQLRDSMNRFGVVQPIVVNKRNNRIVGGHQRASVMIHDGMEEADCVLVDLSDTEEKALNLALNKVSGHWDEEKLGLLLKDLIMNDEEILDFTGFTDEEVQLYIEEEELVLEDEEEDDDGDELELKAETVKMNFDVTVEQREVITEALKTIKPDKKMKNGEALFLLAQNYLS